MAYQKCMYNLDWISIWNCLLAPKVTKNLFFTTTMGLKRTISRY